MAEILKRFSASKAPWSKPAPMNWKKTPGNEAIGSRGRPARARRVEFKAARGLWSLRAPFGSDIPLLNAAAGSGWGGGRRRLDHGGVPWLNVLHSRIAFSHSSPSTAPKQEHGAHKKSRAEFSRHCPPPVIAAILAKSKDIKSPRAIQGLAAPRRPLRGLLAWRGAH